MGDELRPDIAAAAAKLPFRMGAKREIRKLAEHLVEKEQVEAIVTGTYAGGTGIAVLSDRRLLFLKDGITSKTSEDFPLSRLSSVQWRSGMMLGTIELMVQGSKAEITNVPKDPGRALVDALRSRLSDGPAAPIGSPVADPIAQLRDLGALKEAGILTDEEFAAKKADILARM